MLPVEALVMPPELAAVDVLLDDPRFFEPFRRWFDPTFGPPSIPMETYLEGLAISGQGGQAAERVSCAVSASSGVRYPNPECSLSLL